MSSYNFTDRVRRILSRAREEAIALGHGQVSTEHILLGLINEDDGVAVTVLENLGLTADRIRTRVLAVVAPPDRDPARGPDLPYTSRAKKVLELAMKEARELNHDYVGSEHLLLGLLREDRGAAAQALTELRLDIEGVRAESLRVLDDELFRKGVRPPPIPPAEPFKPAEPVVLVDAIAEPPAVPELIAAIMVRAFEISEERGASEPGVADLLQALVFSSRETAAAFAAREIEIGGLISEIRGLTENA